MKNTIALILEERYGNVKRWKLKFRIYFLRKFHYNNRIVKAGMHF